MKLEKSQIGMTFEIGDGSLWVLIGHIEGATWPWVFRGRATYKTYYNDDGVLLDCATRDSDFDKLYASKNKIVKCLGLVPQELVQTYQPIELYRAGAI